MKLEVSVILPYYEGENWLRRSLNSVLSQEGISFEIIVIDDGSVRPASAILQTIYDQRISTKRILHSGKGAALNEGARLAEADVLCFIDQDDIMNPGRLSVQYAVLAENHFVDAVYSDYERVDEYDTPIDVFISRQASCGECLHEMAVGRGLVTMQTIMIRKNIFWKTGGFSEDQHLTGLDDAEFLARLFASHAILKYVPGIVQKWVHHNMNYMKSEAFNDARMVLLEHLTMLSRDNDMIGKELPNFRFHAYYMRGLFYLEANQLDKAINDLIRATSIRPFQLNAHYLLMKSFMKKFFD